MSKHKCPNCNGDTFETVAHVMQAWEVDEYGNFIKVLDDCLQVSYRPDDGNIWTCIKCYTDAVIVEE